MKLISDKQTQAVAGGTFRIVVDAVVPDSLDSWVTTTLNKIRSNSFENIYFFRDYLTIETWQGIDLMEIKIKTITFDQINK